MSSTEGTYDAGTAHAISQCADRVAQALAAVSGSPAWSMSPDEQRTTLAGLSRVQAQVSELRFRVLASADRNDVGKVSGSSSTAAWLAHETRQMRTRAHADVTFATELDTGFEATRAALADGRILEEQARVIVKAISELPDEITAFDRGRAEAHLIGEAANIDAKGLRILGRRLFEVIDPDAADEQEGKKLKKEEDEARRKAFFKIRDNGDGSHTGSFKLPTLHAEMLMKTLNAFTSPRRIGPEGRTDADGNKLPHPTLLGLGFMELIEHLPTKELPNSGGNNVTLVVTIGIEKLMSGLGAATLDTGGKISAGEARRLACNAGIIPMVLDGDSMPLDLGREQHFYSKYQRIAMAQRDKGCTAENCDRPPAWVEAHHEVPWCKGGHTSLENGRSRCSWHHHLDHDDRYVKTNLPNGKVRYRRRQ